MKNDATVRKDLTHAANLSKIHSPNLEELIAEAEEVIRFVEKTICREDLSHVEPLYTPTEVWKHSIVQAPHCLSPRGDGRPEDILKNAPERVLDFFVAPSSIE